MLFFFMVMSLLMCVFFYFNLDPMKCSFFLVLSLIFLSFFFSFGMHVWYSYFIVMVFLSGVFVIIVYFSSLSKFSYLKSPLWFLFFLCGFLVGKIYLSEMGSLLGINEFYYDCYWSALVFIILSLIFFMDFVSYYISLGGAMRKM